jgi:hypothetical protein
VDALDVLDVVAAAGSAAVSPAVTTVSAMAMRPPRTRRRRREDGLERAKAGMRKSLPHGSGKQRDASSAASEIDFSLKVGTTQNPVNRTRHTGNKLGFVSQERLAQGADRPVKSISGAAVEAILVHNKF